MKTIFYAILFLFTSLTYAASFERVNGDIYVNFKKINSKKAKSITLKINDVVEAKGKKSFCQVTLDNGTTFLVRDGKIKIFKLKSDDTLIGLINGTLFSSVTKGKPGSFRVKTKTAALGVRGTKFYVQATKDSTYLCVCEGSVEFRNKKEKKTLGKLEDVTAGINDKLETSKANKMMLQISKEGFALMGIDLNIDGSDDW